MEVLTLLACCRSFGLFFLLQCEAGAATATLKMKQSLIFGISNQSHLLAAFACCFVRHSWSESLAHTAHPVIALETSAVAIGISRVPTFSVATNAKHFYVHT